MSNLSTRKPRRKAAPVENPSVILDNLDGTQIPSGIIRDVRLGPPTTLPLRMLLQLPPGSVPPVAGWLDMKCHEYAQNRGRPVYGLYYSTKEIAKATGLSESSVRVTALPWLVENRWAELTKFTLNGEVRTMIWCKWLFPHYLEGAELTVPFGHKLRIEGDVVAVVPPPIETDFEPEFEPEFDPFDGQMHARMAQKSAPPMARISAPEVNHEWEETNQKTTDGKNSSSSSFVQVSKLESIPPAPPLDPAIRAALDTLDSDDDRDELLGSASSWSASFSVEWIVALILEVRAKQASTEPASDLTAWASTVLDNWRKAGKVKPYLSKKDSERRAAAKRQADAAAAELKARRERAEKIEAERVRAERETALAERWDRAEPVVRTAIEDAVRSRFPFAFGPNSRPTQRRMLCLSLFEERYPLPGGS